MTLGQRIAQKRKELGLSQEGLGERLGVSWQAIYKWESDASLPEIDKLITLSKIFSVSVGWLLGVEEVPRDEPASPPGELPEEHIEFIWRRPRDVALEPGHEYCEAAVYTDEYGRQRIYPGDGLAYNDVWEPSTPYVDGLTDWEF